MTKTQRSIAVVIVVFLILGGWWYISNDRKAKALYAEIQVHNQELDAITAQMGANIKEGDVVSLQVHITDAQAKVDRMAALIEEHRDGSVRISNADELLDKLSKARKGLDLMEKGIIEKDESLIVQGVALIKSTNTE